MNSSFTTSSSSPQQQVITIRIQLIDGKTQIEQSFAPHCTLEHVAMFVKAKAKELNLIEINADSYNIYTKPKMLDFMDPVPPRTHYRAVNFKNATLEQLGFKGRIRLNVVLGDGAVKEKEQIQEIVSNHSPQLYELTLGNKLRGETLEQKDDFKAKLQKQELEQKQAEKKKKKEELDRVRRQIEEDKERRREKFTYK